MFKKLDKLSKKVPWSKQLFSMKNRFPNFEFHSVNTTNKHFIGELQPTKDSPKYRVKILYRTNKKPKVYVLEPEILDSAPHRYSDNSLCLYYPDDLSFDQYSVIADTIIPWTIEWLYFYEIWLEDNVWWGKEAPHYIYEDK
ncbi:hypothetical protein D3Z33_11820 [Senegalia massiliensis]|uniref:Type II CBASS E2 protein domain-containing protein n=1 Tax=Senegalia massiliensis TaxID=1720316 RepID=A0A845R1X3_9CLOT|nr:hypothetical protein [Senegalia massiliensis]